jgi:hypothetical protein
LDIFVVDFLLKIAQACCNPYGKAVGHGLNKVFIFSAGWKFSVHCTVIVHYQYSQKLKQKNVEMAIKIIPVPGLFLKRLS